MKKNENGFSTVEILLVLVLVGVIGFVAWFVGSQNKTSVQPTSTQTQSSSAESEKVELQKGTFGDKGDYGTFQAEGYAKVLKVDENCFSENCDQYDYVFFYITRAENTHIHDFLKGWTGNTFVKDSALGLGCPGSTGITYLNSSDAQDTKSYTITKDDSDKILASTPEKPVRLEVERLEFTGGKDAPNCYSHFTTFKLLP